MTSTYFLNCIMGNVFMTKLSPTLPKKVYLGLSSTAPQVDGTGVSEPLASAGYQRVELTNLGELLHTLFCLILPLLATCLCSINYLNLVASKLQLLLWLRQGV